VVVELDGRRFHETTRAFDQDRADDRRLHAERSSAGRLARMEALASGYRLVEAPCADGEAVYFSDALGGGVHRWSPDGGVETVIPKRRGIGGMCLHADGGLVVSGREVVHVRDGESRTLLSVNGATGFNDLMPGPDGDLYVGALRFMPFGGEEPVPGEIWHVAVSGESQEVVGGIKWANGIGLSPSGDVLYVCDFAPGAVIAVDLRSRDRYVFARTFSGDADGLAVDVEGGVWVALGRGGAVGRFSARGQLEEILDVPATFVASICFGGLDGRDLYIATADNTEDPGKRGTLFRTRVDRAGLPRARASI
jgi:sugar lactone lactonase YvrE